MADALTVTQPPGATDPELQALPPPRRPWRRATLVTLVLTLFASFSLCGALLGDVRFALTGGQPTELLPLAALEPGPELANRWVHGTAHLGPASGYRRPLDPDRFRIAPVEGNPKIWIELREPAGSLHDHFVPPTSFVGRLVRLDEPGLRHRGLRAALESSRQPAPPAEAWLLIDGESPDGLRWVLGVVVLLLGFGGFSAWGVFVLLAPAKPTRR